MYLKNGNKCAMENARNCAQLRATNARNCVQLRAIARNCAHSLRVRLPLVCIAHQCAHCTRIARNHCAQLHAIARNCAHSLRALRVITATRNARNGNNRT